VRYRYDETIRKRFKTVEIIVAEAPWKPKPVRMVFVEIEAWETKLRAQVRRAGGRWNPDRAQWRLAYDCAVKLGLTLRVLPERPPAPPPLPRPVQLPAQLNPPIPTLKKLLSAETSKLIPAETSPGKHRQRF
jgi:hypothetical protein